MSQNIPPRAPLPPQREIDQDDVAREKDQYSLDEMMKALREKEREKEEKGEIVTRSDGSIARKVKIRKRRSDQPEKATPEKEKRSFLVKVIVAAVLLLALFLTGLFLLVSHNSKGHREKLEAIAGEWTGAEVEFNGYKRLPFSTTMEEASFHWPAASYLKSLEVKKLSGDVKFFSFLGVRPSGLQFGGRVGELVVGMPTASGEVGQKYEEDEYPFAFEQYYCQALDVNFGETDVIGIRGTSASFYNVSNAGWQTTLDSGVLQVDGWKDFPISSGLLRFEEGMVSVKSLSLKQPNEYETALTSSLKISGDIPISPGKKTVLKTSTEHFALGALIGDQLAPFFKGIVLNSNGAIEYSVGESRLDEVMIDFAADTVVMSRFPFLNNLRELFPSQNLEEITFDSGFTEAAIKGRFRARPEGVAMENFEMSQKGNLKLKGGLIISKSGQIAGAAELSINRAFFATDPGLQNHPILRGSEKSGYAVVKFKLGGTVDEPGDTFSRVMGMEASLPGTGRDLDENEDLWKEIQRLDLKLEDGE